VGSPARAFDPAPGRHSEPYGWVTGSPAVEPPSRTLAPSATAVPKATSSVGGRSASRKQTRTRSPQGGRLCTAYLNVNTRKHSHNVTGPGRQPVPTRPTSISATQREKRWPREPHPDKRFVSSVQQQRWPSVAVTRPPLGTTVALRCCSRSIRGSTMLYVACGPAASGAHRCGSRRRYGHFVRIKPPVPPPQVAGIGLSRRLG
jgi:hypothetical protein